MLGRVDSYGEISDAPTGTGYTDVSGGEGHHCAINPTQGIECWGRDNYNEVNQTPTTGTFTDLEAGGYHTCAIDTSGGITCWGYIHGTSGAP